MTREEELCCHSAGNFIIQRLLDHVDDKEMFVKMSEMMSGLTETILEHGCTGKMVKYSYELLCWCQKRSYQWECRVTSDVLSHSMVTLILCFYESNFSLSLESKNKVIFVQFYGQHFAPSYTALIGQTLYLIS